MADIVALDSGDEIELTAFPHPQPDLTGITKQLIRYERDGEHFLHFILKFPLICGVLHNKMHQKLTMAFHNKMH